MSAEIEPLSGFRDLLPEQAIARRKVLGVIEKIYGGYGFAPLETPAIEREATLTGKYGEEGEKLMYKFVDHGGRNLALRYDLTVPLARVVAQYRQKLPLPFKRFQVGNVWRGESPQAGRYREFMQFDADTVGVSGAVADTEVVAMMSDTMESLGVEATVRVNNRRILDGLAQVAGIEGEQPTRRLMGLIDKTDKLGRDTVVENATQDFGERTGKLLAEFLSLDGDTDEARLLEVQELLKESAAANEGVGNLTGVFELLHSAGYETKKIVFDPTIARGLDYYTGIIYETTINQLPNLGSVCSGGRFDNLVAALGGPDLPAVGTSVGVDRLLDGLAKLGKLESRKVETQVLVANLDEEGVKEGFKLATRLRREGVPTDVYGEPKKLEKQLKYADKLGILLAAIIGEDEVKSGNVTVKDLTQRSQVVISLDDAAEKIKIMLRKSR